MLCVYNTVECGHSDSRLSMSNHMNTSARFMPGCTGRATRGPAIKCPHVANYILWLFIKATNTINFNFFIEIFLHSDVTLLALANYSHTCMDRLYSLWSQIFLELGLTAVTIDNSTENSNIAAKTGNS